MKRGRVEEQEDLVDEEIAIDKHLVLLSKRPRLECRNPATSSPEEVNRQRALLEEHYLFRVFTPLDAEELEMSTEEVVKSRLAQITFSGCYNPVYALTISIAERNERFFIKLFGRHMARHLKEIVELGRGETIRSFNRRMDKERECARQLAGGKILGDILCYPIRFLPKGTQLVSRIERLWDALERRAYYLRFRKAWRPKLLPLRVNVSATCRKILKASPGLSALLAESLLDEEVAETVLASRSRLPRKFILRTLSKFQCALWDEATGADVASAFAARAN